VPHLRPRDRTGVLAFPLQIPRLASDPIARRSTVVAGELRSILNAVPSVLCWGMKDNLFDATTLRTWMDFLPHARVVQVEHASHYVPEDTPTWRCRPS
jgi:haloalkane dehalogenase